MNDFASLRFFRLSRHGIECDEDGLRVGGVALLARDAKGVWAARNERDLGRDLSRAYGFAVDVKPKLNGFAAVANALQSQNIAKAQIAALLLQLPDPLLAARVIAKADRGRLAHDLVACGLLKADDDWDEQHPRTGTPPNPGWFAPKPEEPGTAPAPDESAPSHGDASGGEVDLVPHSTVDAVGSVLTIRLSAEALGGLATLAARFDLPVALFDAIFIPSANPIVDEGPVPGRPDMSYRWAHDETEVTFKVLIDGQWRTFTVGEQKDDLFYDRNGEVVARLVSGPSGRPTLVTTVDVLDRALVDLRRNDGEPATSPAANDNEPKLCPDTTKKTPTTDSKNSIEYQEYVTGLDYQWVIMLGGVEFDGCDPKTGILLEAKADIDFMFDDNDVLNYWIKPKKDPTIQMESQAQTALAAGRIVVWHAQTPKGFRALSNIKSENYWPNLFVIYDPN